ncbi:ROK family protein [Fusobacterium gonidiaformans 3-1-5R]|uniref:ROK family protein n=1 Tax=Fusobacterium gonidiaformans 3-1-5R TaxID=469605 RepID=E5BGI4_9FUSO|nr:ROK family transcriptional regulator [Fusobacterium gonidiaformans]AVQ16710.1 ROK family transcriptional regulator [Fusobacterium gonidiaformans ATCC 25563]EFS21607.1 ROK family protein [Fusobacterium gonidiaformans 3-1-5R]EFS28285.1 hypothetical protein FGAG_00606 [Fusobacterium gonidiaformans ATCC 25563]
MRKEKEERILECIREQEKISRISLAKLLQWNPTTVGSIVAELLKKSYIQEVEMEASTGGRKATLLSLKEDMSPSILGISFAPSFLQIGIGSIQGKIFETEKIVLTPLIIEKIWQFLFQIIDKKLNKWKEIRQISVIISGLVNSEKGVSIFSPHYQWRNIEIKKILEERYQKKVFVENDVRAMALLEKSFGSCKKKRNFVVLNIGDGVGSSIFIDNKLYIGSYSGSGELGHMQVNAKGLRRCSCGKIGCLESEVSNLSILDKISSQIKLGQYSILRQKLKRDGNLSIEDFLFALGEKDLLALQIAEESVEMITRALDAIISLLNPERVILYGSIFQSEYLYREILKKIQSILISEQGYKISLSNFYKEAYAYAPFAVLRYLSIKN